MSETTVWWVLAGVLVAVELGTGTFYLLMLALGAACGAVAAHLGLSLTAQLVTAAGVGAGAVALWHRQRGRGAPSGDAQADASVQMDVGQTVAVDAWGADGRAQVRYRGATWTAEPADPGAPVQPGPHRIDRVVGSHLVVSPLPAR
jgi:membrane protein implicated in regulation of membrane protease activity